MENWNRVTGTYFFVVIIWPHPFDLVRSYTHSFSFIYLWFYVIFFLFLFPILLKSTHCVDAQTLQMSQDPQYTNWSARKKKHTNDELYSTRTEKNLNHPLFPFTFLHTNLIKKCSVNFWRFPFILIGKKRLKKKSQLLLLCWSRPIFFVF